MRSIVLFLSAFLLSGCAFSPRKGSQSLPLVAYVARDYRPTVASARGFPFGGLSVYSAFEHGRGGVTETVRFRLDVRRASRRVRVGGAVILGPVAKGSFGPAWIDLVPDAPFAYLRFPRRLFLVHLEDGHQALTPWPGARKFWRATTPEDYE